MLGKAPAKLLGCIYEKLKVWDKTFNTIDTKNNQIIKINNSGKEIHFVILTHPSFVHLNQQNRRYKEQSGKELLGFEAEAAIIKECLIKAEIKC